MVVADKIALEFRKKHKTEITNVVFITDGDSDPESSVSVNAYGNTPGSQYLDKERVIFLDPITKMSILPTPGAGPIPLSNYIEMFKRRVGDGFNTLGVFLTNGAGCGWGKVCEDADAILGGAGEWGKKWREDGYMVLKGASSYDYQFIINPSTIMRGDGATLRNLGRTASVSDEFFKYCKGRSINRSMLNRMIEVFSTH
jgi:hypothetical protein